MDGKSQTIKEWSEMMFGGSTEQFDGQPSDLVMTRSSVRRLCDCLLHVECGQQLGQTAGVSVSWVVYVHVEVAVDDHLTTKRGDDFQQFRQLVKEPSLPGR